MPERATLAYDRAVLAADGLDTAGPPDPKVLREVRTCRKNFPRFAEKYLQIRTPTARMIPFRLNNVQRRLWEQWIRPADDEERPFRGYILKSRQMGCSTFTEGLAYWATTLRPYFHAFVAAHEEKATQQIFNMASRFYRHTPEAFRPTQKLSNRKELRFAAQADNEEKGIESELVLATAGNDDLGAGTTLQLAHLSEFARWDKNSRDVSSQMATFLQTVHHQPGTYVILETTAQGANYAEEFWYADNGFDKIFLPWAAHEAYSATVPLGLGDLTRDQGFGDEHLVYQQLLDILPGWWPRIASGDESASKEALRRLAWRRHAIKDKCTGKLDLFHREYPLTAEEAFQTTGGAFFDVGAVLRAEREVASRTSQPAGYTWTGSFVRSTGVHHRHDPGDVAGGLLVYQEPSLDGTYVIGADVGGGYRDGDPSAAQVLRLIDDGSVLQVAVFHDYVNPIPFGDILVALGRMYQDAYLVPESNNAGVSTVYRIQELGYSRMYIRDYGDGEVKAGFQTSAHNKPALLFPLQDLVAKGEVRLTHPETLREAKVFREVGKNRWGAPRTKHDDLILALSLAVFGARQQPARKAPAQTEDPWSTFRPLVRAVDRAAERRAHHVGLY